MPPGRRHDRDRRPPAAAHLGRRRRRAVRGGGVKSADRVLDVGCGTGATTRIAARPASRGYAVGVDIWEPLLRTAQKLTAAEKVANAWYQVADARVHLFPRCGYDVIVSRGGVLSFADPAAAFRNLARALMPGGRLVLVCPRSRSGSDRVRAVLDGWENVEVEKYDRVRLVTADRSRRAPEVD
ncbi:class I SAM-dependent methyltransferase [Streptomyces guryensis]|uniref:Class I SAM-dependent methyltransferase n=1 Tax=Streptomyces guryensis TaxID=2886947 RepID=A0A9Q3Z6K4_9ACTN|nr:class I SAM-dependent methyltransferase [Streptomyces guryensis]MCD9877076.1 class I SAM-dependent methyltransferase [Streptomyces guryensis]